MEQNKSLIDVTEEFVEIIEEIKKLEERLDMMKEDMEDLIIKYRVKFICD